MNDSNKEEIQSLLEKSKFLKVDAYECSSQLTQTSERSRKMSSESF